METRNIDENEGKVTWLISDTHWEHANIIQYCKRPFRDIKHMNSALIENWNSKVAEKDIVYFLGDFAFCGNGKKRAILRELNGNKIMVWGNHDFRETKTKWRELGFSEVHDQLNLTYKGHDFILCHFPYLMSHISDKRYESLRPVDNGTTCLHGHIHSKPEEKIKMTSKGTLMLDVGVDANYYRPISMDEIILELDKFATYKL